jgi:hypothetical protein
VNTLLARQPDTPQLLLTSRQAAEALSISERTLWELTAPRGPIVAIRLPGRGITARHLRYPVENLQRISVSSFALIL